MNIKLKFGLWLAAHLFVETGQDVYKVLHMIGLSVPEWNFYMKNYGYCLLLDRKGLSRLKIFGEESANERLNDFLSYFEEEYHSLKNTDDTLVSFSKKVREVVFKEPHIKVFKSVEWQAHYIADHGRIGPSMYTHDNNWVYCCGEKLQDTKGNTLQEVIPNQFYLLSKYFMCDEVTIYAEQKKKANHDLTSMFSVLKKVDKESFRPLELHYAMDDYSVYYKEKRISKLPKDFRQIDKSNYYTDGVAIYFEGKILKEADLASFHTQGFNEASDINNTYYGRNIYQNKSI